MRTKGDVTGYCLHCTVARVGGNVPWCADCVDAFRREALSQAEMRAEAVVYWDRMGWDVSEVGAVIARVLGADDPRDDDTGSPYATLGAALAANLVSTHPSGFDDDHVHASEAGMCARAVWYRLRGCAVTDPPPLSAAIAAAVGRALHPKIATAIAARYARVLLRYEHYWLDGPLSGHADLHYLDRDTRDVVAEIKTMNTFAFAKSSAAPKWAHVAQASINALGVGASWAHLVYVNTGARRGDDPVREWVIPVHIPGTVAERARLAAIATAPTAPTRQAIDDTGDRVYLDPDAARIPWQCAYCPFTVRCREDGAT